MATKMMIIRLFICTAIISVLPACQTTAKKSVDLRIGMSIAELIEGYGKPSSASADREFNYYVWRLSDLRLSNAGTKHSSTTMSGAGSVSSSSNATPQVIRIYCRLNVTANGLHQVQAWQATGEGCRQILLDTI